MSAPSQPESSLSALSVPAYRLRVAQLNPHRPHKVDIRPDKDLRKKLAKALALLSLPDLRLTGTLRAVGEQDWLFEGRIIADVVQPCVVTLAPVPSHLDEAVRRVWTPDIPQPTEEEVEMGDEDVEALGAVIDMGGVLAESLALALPLYPRAPDAGIEADIAEADEADGETRRPFAGLADLMARKNQK